MTNTPIASLVPENSGKKSTPSAKNEEDKSKPGIGNLVPTNPGKESPPSTKNEEDKSKPGIDSLVPNNPGKERAPSAKNGNDESKPKTIHGGIAPVNKDGKKNVQGSIVIQNTPEKKEKKKNENNDEKDNEKSPSKSLQSLVPQNKKNGKDKL